MPTTTDKRERITTPLLFGGISQQPPHARFPHQVQDASNAAFSVADGFSKRPGTVFVRNIAGLTGTNYRLHSIHRDRDELYAVVYGSNNIATTEFHVFEITDQNLKATVDVSGAAQTYLDTLGPEQVDALRLLSVLDYTLIANSRVATAVAASDTFLVERSWRDYGVLLAFSTTDGLYFETENDTEIQRKGHWQYSLGGITFAHNNLRTLDNSSVTNKFLDVGPSGFWRTSANNPMGFRVFFGRFGPTTLVGATWTEGTLTLDLAGTPLANYVFRSGDHVNVGSIVSDPGPGADLPAGIYRVASRTDSNTIVLSSATAVSANTYDTGLIIGNEYEVVADMEDVALTDMQDVAAQFQAKLRAAGASHACVAWYGRGVYGAFQITGPYRGSNATIYACKAPIDAGAKPKTKDLTVAGLPFDLAVNQIINGTGTIANDLDLLAPELRWVRVHPPGQTAGALSANTMPVKLTRESPSGSGTVTAVSVAGDGVVTTGGAHNLVIGQTATMAGLTTAPGNMNGAHVVTAVPTTTTFRCGVDTSGGVADGVGTFTSQPYFKIAVNTWTQRILGDSTTNPAPQPIIDGKTVNDITFHRGRLGLMIGETVVMSQANDLFNFFQEDDEVLVDSDPIEAPLSDNRVVIIDYAVPFRNSLTLFTRAGKQFDFSAPEALTPSTASSTSSTAYQTLDVRPQTTQGRIYFMGTRGCQTQMLEYFYDDLALASDANEVTGHVRDLLPETIRSLSAFENANVVFVVQSASSSMFVYQMYWTGPRQKQQSAWTKFTFDPSYLIQDVTVLSGRVYMLTKTANLWFIERLPIIDEPLSCNYDDIVDPAPAITEPYTTHLDRRFYKASGSGTFNATDQRTEFDLGVQTPGSTVNSCVNLSTGEEVPVVYWSGTTVGVQGDVSAVNVVIGCKYTMSVELTRPYIRNEQGQAELDHDLLVDKIVVSHRDTGSYTVKAVRGAQESTKEFSAADFGTETGEESFHEARGSVRLVRLLIESDKARPATIASVQYIGTPREGLD